VVTDAAGYMTRIVEKPSTPVSKLANIGLYYVRDVRALWAGIDHVLAQPTNKGEYYLTDAFQHMIEHGRRILAAEVGGWYDCGAVGTLLETNARCLRRRARRAIPGDDRDLVHGEGPRSSEHGGTTSRRGGHAHR
jgi:glucose-1-phosphate thymidylyltransferase